MSRSCAMHPRPLLSRHTCHPMRSAPGRSRQAQSVVPLPHTVDGVQLTCVVGAISGYVVENVYSAAGGCASQPPCNVKLFAAGVCMQNANAITMGGLTFSSKHAWANGTLAYVYSASLLPLSPAAQPHRLCTYARETRLINRSRPSGHICASLTPHPLYLSLAESTRARTARGSPLLFRTSPTRAPMEQIIRVPTGPLHCTPRTQYHLHLLLVRPTSFANR
jgi:hypothetical protein